MRGPLPKPIGALRERLRSIARAVGETRQHVDDATKLLSGQIDELSGRFEATAATQQADIARMREVLRAICDREPSQRERLHGLRATDGYLAPFTDREPLVSVVIPTFDNHRLLRERAIPSVLAQTYQRFEIVVVGDAAPAEAREAVESFCDARVRYSNLPYRGPYPDDARSRWYVAGVPPYNEAVRLARGSWIAPLDDDDAFRRDHIERLLREAQRDRLELVYGASLRRDPDGSTEVLGRFPPEQAQFGLQSTLYHAGIAEIFELELTDWLFDLPYDWGLAQRMLRAGVRMRMLDDISVDYYPSLLWTPRDGAATPPQEWEYVPEGWSLARNEAEPCSRGWNVERVALTYAEHWPAFRSAISGAQPLAVAHELIRDGAVSNTSLVAHNTALTLGYVLARAARSTEALSVLDWGGGLGHQYAIAQSMLPDVQFDWHTRELPAVCRQGRLASPSVSFHEGDDCLERDYDVVLASSSFQYAEDWRAQLARLRHAARESLLLTRVPLVVSEPSFVVIQRAQAYGYDTEYLGWVFNRVELLDEATASGLCLVREFFLQEPIDVAGAPERPSHGAFLFQVATG
jgi:putative methyltransferase (TIGR04325 family)